MLMPYHTALMPMFMPFPKSQESPTRKTHMEATEITMGYFTSPVARKLLGSINDGGHRTESITALNSRM